MRRRDRRYLWRAYLMISSVAWVPALGAGPWWIAMEVMLATAVTPMTPVTRVVHAAATFMALVLPLVAMTGAFVAGWRVTTRVKEETAKPGVLPCLNCGHTLQLTEPRCPECGVVVDAKDVTDSWAQIRKDLGIKPEKTNAPPRLP